MPEKDQDSYDYATQEELFRTLEEDELTNVPVLVFCNKQDLPKAMS